MTMRVLMTADTVGGVWTYAVDLARGLAADRIATTLAVMGPATSAKAAEAARRIPGLVLIDTGLPLDWLADDEAEIARAAAAIAALGRRAGADLVHLNSPSLAAFGDFTQPVIGVCHSCLATWWNAVRGGQPDPDMLWRHRLLERGYSACDMLVAPSASFAAVTAAQYGMTSNVVYNGREATPGSGPRGRYVLTAGRLWDDGKNVAALDAAAAWVDAPVLAAGSRTGPHGSTRTLRHAQALGRLDASELREWMSGATVFASMALYEPFGLSVLEAAQAGCALVLSDITSFRELWDGAALFVPANQPRLLAATLQALLDDPTRAETFGRAAQLHARRYGVDTMAAAMAEIYRQSLRRGALHRASPERLRA